MSDPALLAAFDAMYPVADGHAAPTGLDLDYFARTGHRPGDTPANRRFMEEGPCRPVAAPPPVPAGVRDPSEEGGGLVAPDPVMTALDLLAGARRPAAPARREIFDCRTHGQSLATAAGGCPLCESSAAAGLGDVLPGFEAIEEEQDPLHPLYRGPGVDFGKRIGHNPSQPPEGPAATENTQPIQEDTMSTLAPGSDAPTASTPPPVPVPPPAAPAPGPAKPAAPKAVPGNPFQAAEAIPKRLKLFLYGPWGAGKTIMSLQFPAVALIDMERGADHYAKNFPFHRLPVNSLKEINAAVRWLLTADHEYRTLVLDPITIYWDALQTRWADYFGRVKARGNPEGAEVYTFEPKDYKPMKDEFKEFLRLLGSLDMNVICTAHEVDKYSENKFMEKEGKRPDCEKSAPHFFDTVGRIYIDPNGRRVIRLEKDRTNRFTVGQDFPAEYAVFEQCLGADDLTKKAEARALPAQEQFEQPQAAAPAPGAGGGNGGSNGAFPATAAQLAKLTRLAKGNQQTLDELAVAQGKADANGKPAWTSREASALIDKMKAGGVTEVWG